PPHHETAKLDEPPVVEPLKPAASSVDALPAELGSRDTAPVDAAQLAKPSAKPNAKPLPPITVSPRTIVVGLLLLVCVAAAYRVARLGSALVEKAKPSPSPTLLDDGGTVTGIKPDAGPDPASPGSQVSTTPFAALERVGKLRDEAKAAEET